VQTAPAAALFGDETLRRGLSRAVVYRWFTEPAGRAVYPEEDHPQHGRAFVADLRAASARSHTRARAEVLVRALLERSPEFAAVWGEHEVGVGHGPEKRLCHPELGVMTVQCQLLHDVEQAQVLLVFTATPGTESHEKLALLAVMGRQRLSG
jgi:MmyB-like transcription regulator ligand binding domain